MDLPTLPLLAISRTLSLRSYSNTYRLLLLHRPSSRCFSKPLHHQPSRGRPSSSSLLSFAGGLLRNSSPAVPIPLASISNSAEISAGSGGGDDGSGGSGGGGGGDGGSSGGTKPVVAGEGEDVSTPGTDVIILDVGGMSCGGCAASVKRILESQPQVSSASVNLATETAIVWAVPEAKVAQNWKRLLGEELASHLTTCGFKTNLRGQWLNSGGDIIS